MMTPAISVVICTHNPRVDYLTRVLEALRGQTLPPERWELLVVDNASKDPVAPRFDLSWHPNARHVREDELGLTPARLRGIAESKADLLVFVDDDNVLDPDYLEQAERIAGDYPFLGAFGAGIIRPEFEVPPADWLTEKYHGFLALRRIQGECCWSNRMNDYDASPVGAGMCAHRKIALLYASAPKGTHLLGRRGTELFSAEDTDLVWTSSKLGLGIGVFRPLGLTHLMPAGRLSLDYMQRIVYGILKSHQYALYKYGLWRPPPPRGIVRRWAGAARRAFWPREIRLLAEASIRALTDAERELSKQAPASATSETPFVPARE